MKRMSITAKNQKKIYSLLIKLQNSIVFTQKIYIACIINARQWLISNYFALPSVSYVRKQAMIMV